MAKLRKTSTIRMSLLVPLVPAMLCGCSSAIDWNEPGDDPSALGEAAQELYGNLDTYWTGAGTSRINLKVCWENPSEVAAAHRDSLRDAVEKSWGVTPGSTSSAATTRAAGPIWSAHETAPFRAWAARRCNRARLDALRARKRRKRPRK